MEGLSWPSGRGGFSKSRALSALELLLALALLAAAGGFALKLGSELIEGRALEAEALRLCQFVRGAFLRANLERKTLTLKFYDSVGEEGAALVLFGPESAVMPLDSFRPREGFKLTRVLSSETRASEGGSNAVSVLPDFRCVPALTLGLELKGRKLYVVVVSATGRVWIGETPPAR